MHFVGVALLCATLGAAGSYLMSRSDKQIDPPLPEIAPSVLKKAKRTRRLPMPRLRMQRRSGLERCQRPVRWQAQHD